MYNDKQIVDKVKDILRKYAAEKPTTTAEDHENCAHYLTALTGLFDGPAEEVEIEERVVAEIRSRRDHGRAKYGTSMERGDLTQKQWLQHAKEEALDLAIYLEKLISLLP